MLLLPKDKKFKQPLKKNENKLMFILLVYICHDLNHTNNFKVCLFFPLSIKCKSGTLKYNKQHMCLVDFKNKITKQNSVNN